MNDRNNKRRNPPPPSSSQPPPPKKKFQQLHQAAAEAATAATMDEGEEMDEEVFLDETLLKDEEQDRRKVFASRLSNWKRPNLSPSYLSQSQNIIFQQLEIDYVIGDSHRDVLPNSSGDAAILRIFGVTRQGHSVCCNVHGFQPYFYINCPSGMCPDETPYLNKQHFMQRAQTTPRR